ncbi:hypothetical protein, partial [Thiolapillus sp.]|uniref:hypothetical protein n=1 Tax=Thiolapillus sp. TaxID=2017437 RepID=UPI003AF8C1C8
MFSLWRKARRENSAASRLLGSTSLRFALHGWQRMHLQFPQQVAVIVQAAHDQVLHPVGALDFRPHAQQPCTQ